MFRPALVLVLLCGSASTALAVPCAEKMSRKGLKDATPLVEEAKDALISGRFELAFQLYTDAYCLLPDPGLKKGLSAAALNLGRCAVAIDHAASWAEHAAPTEQAAARRWLTDVRAQCPEVQIDSTPSAATLYLDGSTDPLGLAPWHGPLHVGAHSVLAKREGYLDTPWHFEATVGQQSPATVTITLQAPPTAQQFVAEPLPPIPNDVPLPPVQPPPSAPAAAPPPPPAAVTAEPIAPRRNNGALVGATWAMFGVAAAATAGAATAGSQVLTCQPHGCEGTNAMIANGLWGLAAVSAVTGGVLLTTWIVSTPATLTPEKKIAVGVTGTAFVASGTF